MAQCHGDHQSKKGKYCPVCGKRNVKQFGWGTLVCCCAWVAAMIFCTFIKSAILAIVLLLVAMAFCIRHLFFGPPWPDRADK